MPHSPVGGCRYFGGQLPPFLE